MRSQKLLPNDQAVRVRTRRPSDFRQQLCQIENLAVYWRKTLILDPGFDPCCADVGVGTTGEYSLLSFEATEHRSAFRVRDTTRRFDHLFGKFFLVVAPTLYFKIIAFDDFDGLRKELNKNVTKPL